MTEIATLESQLAALRAARATGAQKVRFADREVTYRSDSELAAAIADIERRLAALRGQRVSAIYVHSSKGL